LHESFHRAYEYAKPLLRHESPKEAKNHGVWGAAEFLSDVALGSALDLCGIYPMRNDDCLALETGQPRISGDQIVTRITRHAVNIARRNQAGTQSQLTNRATVFFELSVENKVVHGQKMRQSSQRLG